MNVKQIQCVQTAWDKGRIYKQLVIKFIADGEGCMFETKNSYVVAPLLSYNHETLSHTQAFLPNDILFRIVFDLLKEAYSLELYRLTSNGRTLVLKNIPRLTDEVNNALTELANIDNCLISDFERYLPGVDKMKPIKGTTKYENFIAPLKNVDPEMYAFVCGELVHSSICHLPTVWNRARAMPKLLNVRERLTVDNSDKTISHVSEHWLLFYKDGRVEFPDLPPDKGAKINIDTQQTIKVYNEAPTPCPDDVIRAVKITIGALVHDDGIPKGIAWQLYARK